MWLLPTLLLCLLGTGSALARPAPSLASQASSVRYLLRELAGVTVAVDGDHLAIKGTARSLEELDRVVRVTQAFPGAQNFVVLRAAAAVSPAQLVEDAIHLDPGCAAVHVELGDGTLVLSGIVATEAFKRQASQIAESYLPGLTAQEPLKLDDSDDPPKKLAVVNLIQVRAPPSPR